VDLLYLVHKYSVCISIEYQQSIRGDLIDEEGGKMIKREHSKGTYMGYAINCSPSKPSYLAILSDLFERIQVSKETFTRPLGFHIRYRLKDSVDDRLVSDRLNKYFSNPSKHRKAQNTFKPIWLQVREVDPNRDGEHRHMALVIDGKKATRRSLCTFFANLMKKGFLDNYCIPKPDEPEYKDGVCLKSEEGIACFFYWLSYIAKVRTKEFIRQTYSVAKLN